MPIFPLGIMRKQIEHMGAGIRAALLLAAALVFGLPSAHAERAVLVDFGDSAQTTMTPYGDWTELLRHPTYTEFVRPDENPEHWGITATATTPNAYTAYHGIRGTTPVNLARGHKIIATFFNRTELRLRLQARISFSDADQPADATWDAPWNTMYAEDPDHNDFVASGALFELVYNITDASSIAGPLAIPTAGDRRLVNIAVDPTYNSWHGAFVLTRIELTDEADLTPPTPPANLSAQLVAATAGVTPNLVELRWNVATDPTAGSGKATGVARYNVYRNGAFIATVSRDWILYYGDDLRYQDFSVSPRTTYSYAVTAVDAAVTGHFRVPDNAIKLGNESAPATIEVTTPVFTAPTLVDPHGELHFAGAFRLPAVAEGSSSDFGYAYKGLAYYPVGNPGHDSATELPGSLYAIGHSLYPQIAEVSIPRPQVASTPAGLPRARLLRPFSTDVWPAVYPDGAGGLTWRPEGSGDVSMGIGYHPGGGDVDGRLYYGIYRDYSSSSAKAHGAVALDLAASAGAWYIGGAPGSPEHVPPVLTDKLIFAVPQAWADQHTGGRSLLVGQGYQSGVGVPSHGPALYAIAPWASGSLPADEEVVTAKALLRYGGDWEVDRWLTNWSLSLGYSGAAWLGVGSKAAIVVCASRPLGDEWYGGTDGTVPYTSDLDLPSTRTSDTRGPTATEREASLYFYDPDDLAKVAEGQLDQWEPQPYAVYDFKGILFGGTDRRFPQIGAIAYDADNGYLYFIESNSDNTDGEAAYQKRSMIYVWKVAAANPVPVSDVPWLASAMAMAIAMAWRAGGDRPKLPASAECPVSSITLLHAAGSAARGAIHRAPMPGRGSSGRE
ncbi:MAG: hypothetical protein HYV63_08820 [Candidatus Schekmanbacteria bacterium]|nr:hypothetical protein [Candidatus Schekmanbacteria bacterium]